MQSYYYRARYYDPQVGRFISEDPTDFSGSGTNFYAYVRNNPMDLADPLGFCPEEKKPCYSGNSLMDKSVRFFSLLRLRDTWREWVGGGGAKLTAFGAAEAGAKSAGGAESLGAAAIGTFGKVLGVAGSAATGRSNNDRHRLPNWSR